MDHRRRYHITGRVQGVGFRWFTLHAAQRCGVVGWVQNQRDGSVLAEAQGTAEALSNLMDELRQGPGFSRVADIAVQELPVREGADSEDSFEIR
ncbi:MAG: acylphosphatase [Planctomycetota bacterium]|jgi:acylphosphatase